MHQGVSAAGHGYRWRRRELLTVVECGCGNEVGHSVSINQGVSILITTAGRTPYIRLCLRSLQRALVRPVDHICVVNCDSLPVPSTLGRRATTLAGTCDIIELPGSGPLEGIRAGLQLLRERGARYVLHVEEDFRFKDKVDVALLAASLAEHDVVQVILPRQRWYRKEFAGRNLVEYVSKEFGVTRSPLGDLRVPMWTFNPAVYEIDRLFEMAPIGPVAGFGDLEKIVHGLVRSSGLAALIPAAWVSHPAVQHLGVVTSTKHWAVRARRPGLVVPYYVGRHIHWGVLQLVRRLRSLRG